MEKTTKSNNNQKNSSNKHKQKYYSKEQAIPKWNIEETSRSIQLKETKADLLHILEDVNCEELLMESLVKKSRALKTLALKKNTDNNILEDSSFVIETPKVKIDLSLTCPICDKPIREIMYALHDSEYDRLAHFDCVYKKVQVSIKEKLINNRYLAYLGSGSFGIIEPGKNNNNAQMTLIEKIYPGTPMEELLHGDKDSIDEEL